MKREMLKSVSSCLAIDIDLENKELIAYDYLLGDVFLTTGGRLKKTNSDLANEIENHFEIVLSDFGVEVFDEEINI